MRIWKWTLAVTDMQQVMAPKGAWPLTAQIQDGGLSLWAQVNEEEPQRDALFIAIYGTGNPMPPNPGRYLSTFQLNDGALVFHVFDRTAEA